jgi:hypothetical protein
MTRKWYEPAPRSHPLFDYYDLGMSILMGFVLGIAYCMAINHGWLG